MTRGAEVSSLRSQSRTSCVLRLAAAMCAELGSEMNMEEEVL